MIFIITYKDQTSTTLSADTWSDAASYAENNGKEISVIQSQNNFQIVLNAINSDTCYFVVMKDNTTQSLFRYIVYETNFQSLLNWISGQTDKVVTNIQLIQRNYVSL
jgi:hypothetical protein